GRLRPLAVTTATRLPVLPEISTVAEFVPGYEATAWIGFGVPKNTPVPIVERLNEAFNAAIADATIKARLAELGAIAMPHNSPEEFAKYIADDAAKWAKVIKASGIKPE